MTSYPYTPRHAGCAALFAIGCALFYPGRQVLSYLVIRNQITALAGNASTVSLCGTHRPVRRQWPVRPQSAFGHATSIAHTCKRGKDGVLPHVALPPRACMRGEEVPQIVEVKPQGGNGVSHRLKLAKE